MKTKIDAVIFDMDGTLSDRRHRLHFLEEKKDWNAFFNAMEGDPPIVSTVDQLLNQHMQKLKIVILTGRPEEYRKQTEAWLLNQGISSDMYELIMRESKNHETDLSLKKRIYLTKLKHLNILKVYDDRKELIEMWQEHGLEVENCSLD